MNHVDWIKEDKNARVMFEQVGTYKWSDLEDTCPKFVIFPTYSYVSFFDRIRNNNLKKRKKDKKAAALRKTRNTMYNSNK